MTPKLIQEELDMNKPQVLNSLRTNTFLSPLHEKLITKAETLKNQDSLFSYHPTPIINIEFKQQIGHAVGERYEFRRSRFGNDTSIDKKE